MAKRKSVKVVFHRATGERVPNLLCQAALRDDRFRIGEEDRKRSAPDARWDHRLDRRYVTSGHLIGTGTIVGNVTSHGLIATGDEAGEWASSAALAVGNRSHNTSTRRREAPGRV